MRPRSLFAQLLFVFFSAAIAIVFAIIVSFHFLADKPYQESFYRNIVAYTNLIADKMRFDPFAKLKIESKAGIKIFSTPIEMRRLLKKKGRRLRFRQISPHVYMTKPGRRFYVKYDDGFETFIIRIKDQHYNPERIDAIIVALIFAILILMLAYYIVQKIFRPVRDIQKYALNFGEGKFDELIPVHGDGQLSEVTKSINEMATRIKNMLDAKRDLFLAIGHELKTPLARLRLQVEMNSCDKEEMIKNINEVNKILDDLLEAERVADHKNLNKEEIDLVEFIDSFCDEEIEFSSKEEQLLYAFDPLRMEILIKNVIGNAKKYAPGSRIHINLFKEKNEILIQFDDQGEGVDEEKLEELTQAFYRPDSARTREKGGVGLGLHLVNNIIKAHDGKVCFQNLDPGFRVLLRLPLNQ